MIKIDRDWLTLQEEGSERKGCGCREMGYCRFGAAAGRVSLVCSGLGDSEKEMADITKGKS